MLNDNDEIPVLKKVIVASGSTVAIGNNIEEALTNLFTDYAVDIDVLDMEDISAIIDSLINANNNLQDSLDSNDLEMIGKDLTKLESLIKQLETAREKEKQSEKKSSNISNTTNSTNTINSIFNYNSTNIVEN
jgi:single-stranded DNA-specific DHH superfamily exonuclease